jgi:hypothetical protein
MVLKSEGSELQQNKLSLSKFTEEVSPGKFLCGSCFPHLCCMSSHCNHFNPSAVSIDCNGNTQILRLHLLLRENVGLFSFHQNVTVVRVKLQNIHLRSTK